MQSHCTSGEFESRHLHYGGANGLAAMLAPSMRWGSTPLTSTKTTVGFESLCDDPGGLLSLFAGMLLVHARHWYW